MLQCEGYKMFKGIMIITPKPVGDYKIPPMDIEGVWLYKPEYDCWYCKGWSYPAEICIVRKDQTI